MNVSGCLPGVLCALATIIASPAASAAMSFASLSSPPSSGSEPALALPQAPEPVEQAPAPSALAASPVLDRVLASLSGPPRVSAERHSLFALSAHGSAARLLAVDPELIGRISGAAGAAPRSTAIAFVPTPGSAALLTAAGWCAVMFRRR